MMDQIHSPSQELQVQPLPENADRAIAQYSRAPWYESAFSWWFKLTGKQQAAIALTALLSAATIPIFPLLRPGKPATIQPPPIPAADEQAIVQMGNKSLESAEQNAVLQVDEARQALLSQEADRLRRFAAGELTDKTSPCFRQEINCPLDRLESEAIARFDRANSERNWDQALAALNRWDAIGLARQGIQPVEVKGNLTTLALRNRLELSRQVRQSEAESLAGDMLRGGKR